MKKPVVRVGTEGQTRHWEVAKICDPSVLALPTNSKVLIKNIKSHTTQKK